MGTFGTTGDLRRWIRIIGVIVVIAAIASPTWSRSFGPFPNWPHVAMSLPSFENLRIRAIEPSDDE